MQNEMSDYGKSLFDFGANLARSQARVVAVGKIEHGKRAMDAENSFAERGEK